MHRQTGKRDRKTDRLTEGQRETDRKWLALRKGVRGGGRGVVTHLHTHFHICLAMKKQKTAKFTRTQDAPRSQDRHEEGNGVE